MMQAIASRQQSVETLRGMQQCVQQQFAHQEIEQPKYGLSAYYNVSSPDEILRVLRPSPNVRLSCTRHLSGVLGLRYDWETLGSTSMLLGDGRPEWIGAHNWASRQDLLRQHGGWYYPHERPWYTSLRGRFRNPRRLEYPWHQERDGGGWFYRMHLCHSIPASMRQKPMRSRQEAQRSIQEAAAALREEHTDGFSAITLRAAVNRAAVKAALTRKRYESDTQTSGSEESTASVSGSEDDGSGSEDDDGSGIENDVDGMCM